VLGLGIGLPNHAEETFLDISVAVVLAVILILVLVAAARRHRSSGRGNWWQGSYAPKDRTTNFTGRRDQ
jgi:hypothetical protein